MLNLAAMGCCCVLLLAVYMACCWRAAGSVLTQTAMKVHAFWSWTVAVNTTFMRLNRCHCPTGGSVCHSASKAQEVAVQHQQHSLCTPRCRLEALYAMTATKAFQFCLTYKRTTEFRRLCDILRNHLVNLNK